MRACAVSSPIAEVAKRLCAIAGAVSIALLAGCTTPAPPGFIPPPVLPQPPAPHQLSADTPDFPRLPNVAPDKTPVRVGIILPFSNTSVGTRGLANAMLKSGRAGAVRFRQSRHHADDCGRYRQSRRCRGGGAEDFWARGAEIIVGPLFAQSVAAVAPLARDRGVPVLAFSTDRSVAGDGVYLLSFQPQNEVQRVIAYAAEQGRRISRPSFRNRPMATWPSRRSARPWRHPAARSAMSSDFTPNASAVMAPVGAVAKTGADAIFIAQGGTLLRSIAPSLTYSGVDQTKVKLLGTGFGTTHRSPRK